MILNLANIKSCKHDFVNSLIAQIWGIAADVCRALAYLHRSHIIHADIKASNVLLGDPQGEPAASSAPEQRIFCAKLAGGHVIHLPVI